MNTKISVVMRSLDTAGLFRQVPWRQVLGQDGLNAWVTGAIGAVLGALIGVISGGGIGKGALLFGGIAFLATALINYGYAHATRGGKDEQPPVAQRQAEPQVERKFRTASAAD